MRARCAEAYAELREHCPVFHSEAWGGFWVASRYEDVYEVGRDVERFASAPGVMLPPVGHGRPLLPMDSDPPEHPEYKRLLLPRFAPAAVAGMEQDVRDLARGLVEDIAGRGEADLYETLCKPLPMLLITRLLGIEQRRGVLGVDRHAHLRPRRRHRCGRDPRRRRLALRLPGRADRRPPRDSGPRRPDLAAPARRRRGPALPRGRDSRPLLLPAHRGPREHGLRDPRDAPPPRGRARASRGRARRPGARPQPRRAVAAPLHARNRALPHGDAHTEVAGPDDRRGRARAAPVRLGEPRPGRVPGRRHFHLDRRDGRHVAFGIGPHRCVGSNLARLEMRVAVEEMLRLIPDFRLADGPDPGWYDATA